MKKDIQIGQIVTYSLGIFPEKPYKYIQDLGSGIALCEDINGNRWKFSYHNLVLASKEQEYAYYQLNKHQKPDQK